jgi:hypothetical protein
MAWKSSLEKAFLAQKVDANGSIFGLTVPLGTQTIYCLTLEKIVLTGIVTQVSPSLQIMTMA